MRKALVLGVIGLAGTLASPVFAEDDFTGFRLGMNMSSDQIEQDFFLGPVEDEFVDSPNTGRFGYGLFGGYGFNKWFAVEAGLIGGSEFTSNIFPEELLEDEYLKTRTDLWGFEASVVGSVWIGNKFSLFGRAGMFAWNAEQSLVAGIIDDPSSKASISVKDNGFDPMFAVGLQTQLDGALIRVEYKMAELGDMQFLDEGDPADPDDDAEIFNTRDTKISSLNFSVVWVLN